jgi:hypothetical protein
MLNSSPAAMATTPERPLAWIGVLSSVTVLVPLPNWPLSLAPQPQTVPSDLSATQWVSPAAMAITPVSLLTWTGTSLLVVVPLPSSLSPLLPQAQGLPDVKLEIVEFVVPLIVEVELSVVLVVEDEFCWPQLTVLKIRRNARKIATNEINLFIGTIPPFPFQELKFISGQFSLEYAQTITFVPFGSAHYVCAWFALFMVAQGSQHAIC